MAKESLIAPAGESYGLSAQEREELSELEKAVNTEPLRTSNDEFRAISELSFSLGHQRPIRFIPVVLALLVVVIGLGILNNLQLLLSWSDPIPPGQAAGLVILATTTAFLLTL